MNRIPFLGSGLTGKSRVVSAQRRLNCYLETRTDGDKTELALIGTPGLTLATYTLPATPDGPVRGWIASASILHVVMGSFYFKLRADNTPGDSFPGVILTNSGTVSISTNGTQVLVVDGVAGYIQSAYSVSGGTLTVIGAAAFPNGCRTCAFLGGFFIVENPAFNGRFQWSASYDGTTWPSLNFATAEQSPDPIVAMDVDHGYLMPMGSQTIEFWQLSGAADAPFSPNIGATQQYGLSAIFSRAHVANSIVFLGQANEGGLVQVYQMVPGSIVPISTTDIEQIINSFSTVTDALAMAYRTDDGHSMYQITFPTAMRSFLYDCTEGLWHEVQTGVSIQSRHVAQYAIPFNSQTLISDYSNTNIYFLDVTSYTDNGTSIKRQLRTKHVLDNHNTIGIDEIFLDIETGVGIPTGQGSAPQVMMQISRDDGRTFGPERWKNIGAGGKYRTPRALWRRNGKARSAVLQFTMTDPVKFVCTGGALKLREREQ